MADDLRHKVTVRLDREITTPAATLLTGGSGQDTETVLEKTFGTVELVGTPLSFGHFIHSKTLSAIFSLTTHTYSPYVALADEANVNPLQTEIIRGQDYQEVQTDFPFGNQLLTGLFLKVTMHSLQPGGQIQNRTVEKTLFDRIGFVARQNGGGSMIDIDGSRAFHEQDIVTLNISVAAQDGAALDAGGPILTDLTAQLDATIPLVEQGDQTAQAAARNDLLSLQRLVAIQTTSLLSQAFFFSSDTPPSNADSLLLARSYFVTPRIIAVSSKVQFDPLTNAGTFALETDILQNSPQVILSSIQSAITKDRSRFVRGMADSVLEGLILGRLNPPNMTVSSDQIFSQAIIDAGFPLTVIDSTQLDTLAVLPLSEEANARIIQTVQQDKIVFVPSAMVEVNGKPTIAWMELDSQTHDTIFVSENGAHQAIVEYDGIQVTVSEEIIAGEVTAAEAEASAAAQAQQIINAIKQAEFIKEKKNVLFKLAKGFGGSFGGVSVVPSIALFSFQAEFLTALLVASIDPSIDDFMVHPPALPGFDTLGSTGGSGLATSILPDPLFTVPFGGVEVPTAFRIGIKNPGPSSDTFSFEFVNVPAGFAPQTSVPRITIPPGETAEVGLCLRPASQVPASGSNESFDVEVTSTTNASNTATAAGTFIVPEIHGVRLTSGPPAVSTSPGTPVDVELSIEAVGNVTENVTFDLDLPTDLNLSGLNPTVLNPGESSTQTVTLTPSTGTPLNTLLLAGITANFVAPDPRNIGIPVQVVVPGVDAIGTAAVAANQLGNPNLAQRLNDLSIALTDLVQNPTSSVPKSQVLANLNAIINLLTNDPTLSSFIPELNTAREALANATTEADILAAVNGIGSALDSFAVTASALARHDFEIILLPNSQVAQPQVPTTFEVVLRNIGTERSTYNLALSALPGGVLGDLNQTSVTLDRNEVSSGIFATLTQTSTTELLAFDFSVDASVDGFPDITRSAQGALTVRNDVLSIIEVTADPPFADPGAQIAVSTRLLNAVNQQQDVLVSYRVLDPSGQEVFASTPIQTTLTVESSLLDLDLGTLDTTGFALGQHTLEVHVTDPIGQSLPGGTGSGIVLMGSPIAADLSVTPNVVPPGMSTVTNTFSLESIAATSGCTLELAAHLPASEFKGNFGTIDDLRGVTLNGDVAYVHGNKLGVGSLHVVDISDPTNPARTGAVIGASSTRGVVDGDQLFAVNAGTFASGFSDLLSFDLSGAGTPTDPVLNDTLGVGYIFAQDLVVNGNAAFVAAAQVLFNGGDVTAQNGTVLSFDVSDPSSLELDDTLFNDNLTTNQLGNETIITEMGGDFFMPAAALADPTTLLVVSSTSTGTDTQIGIGRLLVVDIGDPTNINSDDPSLNNAIVKELPIPGTTLLSDIQIVGNTAYILGSEGGFKEGDVNDRAPTGNIVLASVDVTDPRNPVLIHTQVLNRAARGAGNLTSLNASCLALTSLGEQADTPRIITVNVADKTNFSISQQIDQTGEPRGMAADGAFAYVSANDGLFVYQLRPDDPLRLVGQAPVAGAAGSIRNGDLLYMAGSTGINVFDLSIPDAPQLLRTVSSAASTLAMHNDQLVAVRGGNTTQLCTYSLADAENPQLLGCTPNIPYNFAGSGLVVTDTHAFVTTLLNCLTGLNVFAQNGELLSIDISDPTALFLDDVLLNTQGTNNDGIGNTPGCNQNGGDHTIFSVRQVDADTLYLLSSTSTGSATQTGVGRIRVVDISDPSNMTVLDANELQIPGTVQISSMAMDGDRAFAVASSGGWGDQFGIPGLSGNVVLATLDISDARNPQLVATKTLARGARGVGAAVSLGSDLFAFASLGFGLPGELDETPQIFVVDAAFPSDPVTSSIEALSEVTRMSASDGLLHTASADGLIIYELTEALGIPVTARVQIPNDTDVDVVDHSFNIPPTEVVTAANFDTLAWAFRLGGLVSDRTITWDTKVSNMQPGEARAITLDTSVDFTFSGTAGRLTLPPTFVTSNQILGIDPPRQTKRPGEAAVYDLTVKNPSGAQVTYDLSVQGVPQEWVDLVSSVTLPAGGETNVDVTLTSAPLAALGEYGFSVSALNGTSGSVSANLLLEGEPLLPAVPTQAQGVDIDLSPSQQTAGRGTDAFFTARVTNTGSETDTFTLEHNLPAGFAASFAQNTIEVPPGASNFREVQLSVAPPANTVPGDRIFAVTATSTTNVTTSDQAAGTVQVVANGVQVAITPPAGTATTTYQMRVTNTGLTQDTFDLAAAGPVGVAATLGSGSVTLDAGAFRDVSITLDGLDFAVPGEIELIGVATSETNEAVENSDTAVVSIASQQGVDAHFDPTNQQLPQPGTATFLLLVENVGNIEDAYMATIMDTSGGVAASLTGLDGQPTQTVPLFRLPGLSTGAFVLTAQQDAPNDGTVTVEVQSVDNPVSAAATATLMVGCPTCDQEPDHFLCYETGPTKSSICADDAPINAGGKCDTEEDCGGQEGENVTDETSFCVSGTFPKGLQVNLLDQFEDKDFVIKKPRGLCTPADKNGEGISDDLTHLQSYAIIAVKRSCTAEAPLNPLRACRTEEDCGGNSKGKTPTAFCRRTPRTEKKTNIRVDNQFGTLFVQTEKPDRLLVPTAKDPLAPIAPPDPLTHNVDHFKCYQVEQSKKVCEGNPTVKCKTDTNCTNAGLLGSCNLGFPKDLEVEIADQFTVEPALFALKGPTRLCTPVNKNGEGIKNPEAHLLCYKAKRVGKVCAEDALANPGTACKREQDCGGVRRVTNMCQRQAPHELVRGIHVNNQFGADQLDTQKEEEVCVPSTTTLFGN